MSALTGPLTRPRIVAIAAVAAAAGLAAGLLIITSDHFEDRVAWAMFGPFVGWGFVGTGLYAWRRRPESRFGVLHGRCSASRGSSRCCEAAGRAVLFALGLLLGALWGPLLAHALLSFPSGRLETRGAARARRSPPT